MNLILEKSAFVNGYTYLSPIFEAAPALENYWYLLTDLETNCPENNQLASRSAVLSGAELKRISAEENIQFGWAVLSAFETEPTEIPAALPFADGNPHFWKQSRKPQAFSAQFEIICWDSSATLFIGIPDLISEQLQYRYPDILDLDAENQRRLEPSDAEIFPFHEGRDRMQFDSIALNKVGQ